MENKITRDTPTIYVIAKTKLLSNSGRMHTYALQFEMDLETLEMNIIAVKNSWVPMRVYKLLHLIEQVIKVVDPSLLEGEDKEENVTLLYNICQEQYRKHFILEYGGKKYDLHEKVNERRISISELLPIVRYIERLEEVDPVSFRLAYEFEATGYRMLNPKLSVPWEFWIQP